MFPHNILIIDLLLIFNLEAKYLIQKKHCLIYFFTQYKHVFIHDKIAAYFLGRGSFKTFENPWANIQAVCIRSKV